MGNIYSFFIICLIFVISSSFESGLHIPNPAPVPDYTMIDVSNPPECYALKVIGYGDMYEPDVGVTSSEYIDYDPDESSVWNMSGKFSYSYGVSASVYVKWYSYSGWSYIGSMDYDDPDADITYYGDFLSLMEFDYADLTDPN